MTRGWPSTAPLCPWDPWASARLFPPCPPQLKDLKRQLHLERKRADKLQERLQDILTNSKSRSGEGAGGQGVPGCRGAGVAGLGPEGQSCFLHLYPPALLRFLSVFDLVGRSVGRSPLFFLLSALPLSVSPLGLSVTPCAILCLCLSLSLLSFSLLFSCCFFLLCLFNSLSSLSLDPHNPLMHIPTPHLVSKSPVSILSFCKCGLSPHAHIQGP